MDATGAARVISIPVPGHGDVSALLDLAADPWCMLTLAHGAGAGMRHAFFGTLVPALTARGICTLRYQFPWVEAGRRRPDRAPVAVATVRAAAHAARAVVPELPLFAGGKSFGGRMTSHAQAEAPLPGVRGIVFLGFPLHRPGAPSPSRAAHLDALTLPLLFVQGSRDAMAEHDVLRAVVAGLGSTATLHVIDRADHGFGVPKAAGRTAEDVHGEIADAVAAWAAAVLGAGGAAPAP